MHMMFSKVPLLFGLFAIVILTVTMIGCREDELRIIRGQLKDWPEKGYSYALVPTEKYTPGGIVYVSDDAVHLIARVLPTRRADMVKGAKIGDGKVSGTSNNTKSFSLALSVVGVPVQGGISQDLSSEVTFELNWKNASQDILLVGNDTYSAQLKAWLDRASTDPDLRGKKLYLVQEAVRSGEILLAFKGNWTSSFKAALEGTVEKYRIAPEIKVIPSDERTLTVANPQATELYASYLLYKISLRRGSHGELVLQSDANPLQMPPVPLVDETAKFSHL